MNRITPYLFIQYLLCLLAFNMASAQSKQDKKWNAFFRDVQMARVFEDSKTFVDCTIKRDTAYVLKKYQKKKGKSSFDIKGFVLQYFEKPPSTVEGFSSNTEQSVKEHINRLWDVLAQERSESKGTLIGLPNPYVVPGGRFRENYYWDSYFVMLGLVQSGKIEMAKNMLDNFSYLIDTYGFIPNGNRTYYLGRSQPPFYSLMVSLVAEHDSASSLKDYLPYMEKEYAFWMEDRDSLSLFRNSYKRVVRLAQGEIVNRYWDDRHEPRPESYREDVELRGESEMDSAMFYENIRAACESGWDFSSRWFNYDFKLANLHTTEIAPIDLNCLLYKLETTIAAAYKEQGNAKKSMEYINASENRKLAINKYFWFSEEGFYMDYSFWDEYHTGVHSLAGVFPLFFGIATEDEAFSIADRLESEFLKDGGLVTTLNDTGQQWDSPNGWAPLQWIAIQGLRSYDMNALADDVSYRWCTMVEETFKRRGKILEKYNVVEPEVPPKGGEYPSQDGFGWTNGVYLMLRP